MSNVKVVIPMYNKWELTHNLLWSLYKHERKNVSSVLVMDNCSPDPEVQQGLNWWKAEWKEKDDPLPVSNIRNEENLGFLLSCNVGLKETVEQSQDDDIIILLSNDVQVRGGFVEQVVDCLKAPKTLVGGILYTSSTGWNKFSDKVYPYLEGWLLATTVAGWKELDYFDERYIPCDFEDVDISTVAGKLGYALCPLNTPALHHMSGQTIGFSPERADRTKINQKKFEAKWVK